MAEFKISKAFTTEVEDFSSKGSSLNNDYSAPERGILITLSTADKYIDQHNQIRQLLDSYIALVKKDVEDLKKMQETAERMDQEIAASTRS